MSKSHPKSIGKAAGQAETKAAQATTKDGEKILRSTTVTRDAVRQQKTPLRRGNRK